MPRIGLLAMNISAATLLVLATGGCGSDAAPAPAATAVPSLATGTALDLSLTSPAFANNATIPTEYTCEGAGKSPELAWSGELAAAKSFALVLDDPDAPRSGGYTHWVLYGLPAGTASLPASASPGGRLPAGAKEGKNSAGKEGYTPPRPPKGNQPHHYTFTLYALDTTLALEAGKTKEELEKVMRGHVLAEAEYTGVFGRE